MLIDNQNVFDPPGTPITAGGPSTNMIDLVNVREPGTGTPLAISILSDSNFAAGGAATLNIQVQAAPDAGGGFPGAFVTTAESGPLSLADLNAAAPDGTQLFRVYLPQRLVGGALPRFLQLNYVVATGPFTAGTLQAALNLGRDNVDYYPAGVTVAN